MMDKRLFFPATLKNKNPIADVLYNYMPKNGMVLEIASGSGEHAVAYQKLFKSVIWQASDPNPIHRESINAWISYEGLKKKMPEPLDIDVNRNPWPLSQKELQNITSILCINLLHISPWLTTETLFMESAKLLGNEKPLIIYGPFIQNGKHISKSNEVFDLSLKTRNKLWGLREINAIISIARKNGFLNCVTIRMPANNFSIIFHK